MLPFTLAVKEPVFANVSPSPKKEQLLLRSFFFIKRLKIVLQYVFLHCSVLQDCYNIVRAFRGGQNKKSPRYPRRTKQYSPRYPRRTKQCTVVRAIRGGQNKMTLHFIMLNCISNIF